MMQQRNPQSDPLRNVLGEATAPADVRRRITEQALRHLTSDGAETGEADASYRHLFGQPFGRPRTLALAVAGIAVAVVFVLSLGKLLMAVHDPAGQPAAEVSSDDPSHLATAPAKKIWHSKDAELPVRVGPHRVVLAPRTRLRMQRRQRANVDLALDTGRARFAVRKLKFGSSFRVRTPQLQVEVVGTRFSVSTADNCTRVVVQSGRVRITAAGQQLLLGPGEEDTRCSGDVPAPLEGRSESEQLLAQALELIEGGADARAAALLWRCVQGDQEQPQHAFVAKEALFHLALLEKRRGHQAQARELALRYTRKFGNSPEACRLHVKILGNSCTED